MDTVTARLRRRIAQVVLVGVVALLPAAAFAQASIAGVVRDASGGVLPGVTVEAASAALIEKTRSVVTDGTGQYKIVDLRPGTYTVTFTLSGFSTARRDNVELAGTFTATINIELKVGALEETVVVSGESPIVDVQSVRGQPVIDHKVIDAIPASRSPSTLAGLVPGVTVGGRTDVGGGAGDNMSILVAHGSRATEYRLNLDGIPATNNIGSFTSFTPNLSGTQEIVVDTSNASAETGSGAPRINLIPKEGGNTFHGTLFATGANPSFQSNNVTQDLINRGLLKPNSLKLLYDVNPGAGGPIVRDKVWFYFSARFNEADYYNGGAAPYRNINYGNPNVYTYAPDYNTALYTDQNYKIASLRLTTQVTPKHKIAVTLDGQTRVQCGNTETDRCFHVPINRTGSVSWTAPVTSRLLLEAALGYRAEHWFHVKQPDNLWDLISVTDQGLGIMYRSYASTGQPQLGQANNLYQLFAPRASVSYVTGTHAFKAGYSQIRDRTDSWTGGPNSSQLTYRFNNAVPNQVSEYAYPISSSIVGNQYALYGQDKWTVDRLTISGGVRYDYFHNYYPETVIGPTLLTPTRSVTFPRQESLTFKDVTPRLGLAYDLFGDGKTAVKVSINKYMQQTVASGPFGANPATQLVNSVNRSWTDSNGNFIVDCDLLNTAAQNLSAGGGDVCGAMSNVNFGKPTPNTRLDPDLATIRPYNWEFSTGVQREVGPRVGLNVGYFRRWYGGFTVTDNLLVAAADFSPFSVTAPSDSRLPNGGGYTISGFLDVNPNKFGQADNLLASSDRYGNQTEHWNGVDVTLNARLPQGVLVQGGLSTGRTDTNNCEILAQVPEANPLGVPYCHQSTGFQTQVKALGAYTVPRVRVQLAANFSSLPGELGNSSSVLVGLSANYVVPNALIAPSLGRNLSGNAATATVNLLAPGQMYGERLSVLDVRIGKLLTFGAVRMSANLDINNALNASTVTTENAVYGATWRTPQTILSARLFRISVQMDF